MKRGWLYLSIFAMASWALLARLYPALIPGIDETLAFYSRVGIGEVLNASLLTFYHSLTGFLIAFALVVLSILLSLYSKELKAFFSALNVFLQSVISLF
jgi:NitT/TauT family transport system permease protein